MHLQEHQETVDRVIRTLGGYWSDHEILGRLAEEVGEIARCVNHTAGLKPGPPKGVLENEIGDAVFTLISLANHNGLSVERGLAAAVVKADLLAQRANAIREAKR